MSATEVTNVNPNLRKLVEAGTSPWLDLLRAFAGGGRASSPGWSPRIRCEA